MVVLNTVEVCGEPQNRNGEVTPRVGSTKQQLGEHVGNPEGQGLSAWLMLCGASSPSAAPRTPSPTQGTLS